MSFKNLDQSEQIKPEFEAVVEQPSALELESKQHIIESLVTLRYLDEENNFLHITEMTSFQKHAIYRDRYPLFKLRMKIWKAYMY